MRHPALPKSLKIRHFLRQTPYSHMFIKRLRSRIIHMSNRRVKSGLCQVSH
uniref:Uncharacterized protein n=1 Tax=Rhizophora mucronata TaxID=61149 RepID=A0A2P2IUB2_RHIMU